ncbi:MAG: LTA synthase family protein [Deltaproteobacteria bacterium]|nr:LTA synthase family protein [Deltaproteobacteria bacterium]
MIKKDAYIAMLWRFTLVMLLYSACRLVFYLVNSELFANMSGAQLHRAFLGGLVFDVSAVGYTNALFLQASLMPLRLRSHPKYQAFMRWAFVIANTIGLFFNIFDIGFYRFTTRRTTASIFKEFGHEQNLGQLAGHIIIDFWPLILLWLAMIAALWLLYRPNARQDSLAPLRDAQYYPASILIWLVTAFLVSIGCRGGMYTRHHRPITNANAGRYVDQPNHMAIVLNTPFSIIRTIRQPALPKVQYFTSEDELNAVFDPVFKAQAGRTPTSPNVVIFILESFGAEHSGWINRDLENGTYKGFTPFLDSLMDQGLAFTNAFANGRKTIDAMPSITASIPFLVEPFILSHYSANHINTLASLLKMQGYNTMFFHGAPNGSMGLESFVHMAGFEKYYGMNEYGNNADYDGTWGIWDEEFFQFFAKTLGDAKQPFFAALFSLSSHHPYKVPERYIGKFRKGPKAVEEVINYTDYALERFFKKAAQMSWYKKTIFVITADHGSAHYRPQYSNLFGRFRVPLVFYTPDGSITGRDEKPAQQIDIMPTIMRYVGSKKDFIAFGHDLLDSKGSRFVSNYSDGTYQLIQDEYVLHWDGKKSTGLFNYLADPLCKNNLLNKQKLIQDNLERLLKGVVQQFNTRMIDDKLTVNNN